MNMDKKLKTCCLCTGPILPHCDEDGKPFWWGGNNPKPLMHGEFNSCCNDCNVRYVVAGARKTIMAEDEPSGEYIEFNGVKVRQFDWSKYVPKEYAKN